MILYTSPCLTEETSSQATSSAENEEAYLLYDCDTSTYVYNENYYYETSEGELTTTLDLLSAHSINKMSYYIDETELEYFYLYGSNDNTTWDELYFAEPIKDLDGTEENYEYRTYTIPKTNPYRYYKLSLRQYADEYYIEFRDIKYSLVAYVDAKITTRAVVEASVIAAPRSVDTKITTRVKAVANQKPTFATAQGGVSLLAVAAPRITHKPGTICNFCQVITGQLPFQVDDSKTTADSRTAPDHPSWFAFNGLQYNGKAQEWLVANEDAEDTTWPTWIIVELNARVTDFDMWGCGCYGAAGPTNFNVEGSDDGNTWTLLLDRSTEPEWSNDEMRTYTIANPTMYKFYKFNVLENHYATAKVIDNVIFRGDYKDLKGPKQPVTDQSKITASSVHEDYIGVHAFDGDLYTGWRSGDGHNGRDEWIYVDYDEAFLTDKVDIFVSQHEYGPRDFSIQGSNDATNWITIREIVGAEYTNEHIFNSYDLAPVEAYRYYRLYNHKTADDDEVVEIDAIFYSEVACVSSIPSIEMTGKCVNTLHRCFTKSTVSKAELVAKATIGRVVEQTLTIEAVSTTLSELLLAKSITIEAGVVEPQTFSSDTAFANTIKSRANVEPYNDLVQFALSIVSNSTMSINLCTTVLQCIIALDEKNYSNQLVASDIAPLFRAKEVIFDV